MAWASLVLELIALPVLISSVFVRVLYNQNQTNHSDQSQKAQTVIQWTN